LKHSDFIIRNLCQAAKRYQQGEEKYSDNENDRNNGLRMKKEMTMKEKRFSFFTDPQEKRKANPHCTHLQITQANPQTKICKRVQFISRSF